MKGFVEDGAEDVPVGQVVALLAEEQGDCDKFDGYEPPAAGEAPQKQEKKPEASKKSEEKPAPKKEAASKKEAAPKEVPMQKRAGDRIFASPAARKLASANGFNLADLTGTGPNGRIVIKDVERYEAKSESAPQSVRASESTTAAPGLASVDYEDIPNSKIRKVIAQRLTESKQTIPHYYLTIELCVDKLQEYVAPPSEVSFC